MRRRHWVLRPSEVNVQNFRRFVTSFILVNVELLCVWSKGGNVIAIIVEGCIVMWRVHLVNVGVRSTSCQVTFG